MGRSASLFGLCGLIALAFGVVALLLFGNFLDPLVLVNVVVGGKGASVTGKQRCRYRPLGIMKSASEVRQGVWRVPVSVEQ